MGVDEFRFSRYAPELEINRRLAARDSAHSGFPVFEYDLPWVAPYLQGMFPTDKIKWSTYRESF